MRMRIEYIPIVGLVWAFVQHMKACRTHSKSLARSDYQKTWDAFGNYHIALVSTVVPLSVCQVLVIYFGK